MKDEFTLNKYDETRPFDVIRAEDFGADLYQFYEPLETLIRRVSGVDIAGSRPVFLIGGRGTGKTMVLKFLSIQMQLADFIHKYLPEGTTARDLTREDMEAFLSSRRFVAVYLHFKSIEYGPIADEISALFLPYLSLKIAQQILWFVAILRASGLVGADTEAAIAAFISKQIYEPKLDAPLTLDEALRSLRETVLPRFEVVFSKHSYSSLEEIKRDPGIPVVIWEKLIFGLPNLLFGNLDYLAGKSLFILLDELEYLNEYQKACIGQLIKDSDDTAVVFKVGSRHMPAYLPVGQSTEVLQEPDDFRRIDIADALNAAHGGKKRDYDGLIRSILNRRLERSRPFTEAGITDVQQLLPGLSVEEEALALVRDRRKHWSKFRTYLKRTMSAEESDEVIGELQFPENPIVEKLDMLLYYRGEAVESIRRMRQQYLAGENEQYRRLYQKNALSLLFQLCSDYRTDKKYAGIDVFVHLSSGVIRNAVELCNQSLNAALNFGYQPGEPVDMGLQNMAAKKIAEIKYSEAAGISGNLGLSVQQFINQLGTVFRELHLNRYLTEPEPTHFLTTYSDIRGRAKDVFDASLNDGYLQRKREMDPQTRGESREDDFLINRVLAPKFEISYRMRGRTRIMPSQLTQLVEGTPRERDVARRQIVKRNSRPDPEGFQRSLFDLLRENRDDTD